ncbi:DUF1801 domain-containing protein [Lewinella sp. W8]|uniref:DUF1801 domain-containing protein n=1 Tax=Lewinella sp. W8 TaxID=2528208 RepID=UPI0010682DC0|nr:DUF1801 domain-containing protein [Lewinella sp. W8]MTB53711.1 DUF1801 domain-containing protein [Lewinella sp. W8]
MAENKTKPTEKSPEDFLAAVTDEQQREDSQWILKTMREVTDSPPVMWGPSIIGFGKFRYVYPTGREGDWMLTGFSPRKGKISVYLMSGVERETDLLAKLGKYKTGKSCLYIKRLSDVDLDVLKQLIEASVEKVRNNDIHY